MIDLLDNFWLALLSFIDVALFSLGTGIFSLEEKIYIYILLSIKSRYKNKSQGRREPL
jgi:hypothetical protein